MTAGNHAIKPSKTKKVSLDKLTKSEPEAILNLHKKNDIIIRKLDKGNAVVRLDIRSYNDEANIKINDSNIYKQLYFDPTVLHTEKVKLEINTLKTERTLLEKKNTNT